MHGIYQSEYRPTSFGRNDLRESLLNLIPFVKRPNRWPGNVSPAGKNRNSHETPRVQQVFNSWEVTRLHDWFLKCSLPRPRLTQEYSMLRTSVLLTAALIGISSLAAPAFRALPSASVCFQTTRTSHITFSSRRATGRKPASRSVNRARHQKAAPSVMEPLFGHIDFGWVSLSQHHVQRKATTMPIRACGRRGPLSNKYR